MYESHRQMEMILENKRYLTEREKQELKIIRMFIQRYDDRKRRQPKPIKVSNFKKNCRAIKMMFFDIFTNYNNLNNYD